MPEYLAPGVYVEEIDTGSKPIEGVSTSTCGIVGVAERGPVDVPVLVTSVGEYVRWYGGLLRSDDYAEHRYLPHAVEGFFTNGGKRAYMVRVLDASATRAASSLFFPGTTAPAESVLVRQASEGTGSGASPPALLVPPGTGLAANDWVRVGDGSGAEYRQVAAAPAAETVMVPVALPLSRSHATDSVVEEYVRAVDLGLTLEGGASAGATQIVVRGANADIAALTAGDCVELGPPATAEYRMVLEANSVTVVSATESTVRLRLDSALLLGYAAATAPATVVSRVHFSAPPADSAKVALATAGSGLFFVDDRHTHFTTRANLVSIGPDATREVRRIGELDRLEISPGALGYDAGMLVEAVDFGAARTLQTVITPTSLVLQARETHGLVAGERLVIDPAGAPQTLTVVSVDASTDTITVTPQLSAGHAPGEELVPLAKVTTAAVAAGGRVLALDDRMGLAEGSVLQVGVGGAAEMVTVQSLPALSLMAPDPGNVVVDPPLASAAPGATPVQLLGAPTPVSGRQACVLALPAPAGSPSLWVSDGDSFGTGETVRLTRGGGAVSFHTLTHDASAATPEMLTLQTALARAHPAGSTLVERTPLIDVEALDAGIWGNRLRISVEDEMPGLVSNTTLATMVNATTIRLASASGVQPGTVLELADPVSGATLGDPVKVRSINRSAQNAITLAGAGLSAVQQVIGAVVRSREFRITVRLLRQPDPGVPSRDSQVIDLETFGSLSLDPRHSNYIEKVIGAIGGPLRKWDRRPREPRTTSGSRTGRPRKRSRSRCGSARRPSSTFCPTAGPFPRKCGWRPSSAGTRSAVSATIPTSAPTTPTRTCAPGCRACATSMRSAWWRCRAGSAPGCSRA